MSTPTASMKTKTELRWVSCSREMSESVALYKHLTRSAKGSHWVDTLCGATGAAGGLNGYVGRKPECPTCVSENK